MSDSKVFTLVVKVRGPFNAAYVFENTCAMEDWLSVDFQQLQKKYGDKLSMVSDSLPGLKVGDECNVCGEGSDVFVIRDLIKIEDHRWSFVLDSGCREEVAKCHTDYLNHFYDGGDDVEEDDDSFGF